VLCVDKIEEFGLLVKAVVREADRQVNELLRPLGITVSQTEVLQLLDRRGVMSLGEMGGLIVAEDGRPSRLVDRLGARVGGPDLAAATAVLEACLTDTAFGETVRRGQERNETEGDHQAERR
jgi:hypothetical protein